MGVTCCGCNDTKREVCTPPSDLAPVKEQPSRKVRIGAFEARDIGLDEDEVDARRGAGDPDLEKLRREAEERGALSKGPNP